MKKTPVRVFLFDTYLAVIKGSVGSRMFRHLFASIGGKKKDIARNGILSCGIFVSWILHHFSLIAEPHATVEGTLKAMEESGWKKIRKPRLGAVIVWEPIRDREGEHRHIGFYIGKQKAISNSSVKRMPVVHPLIRPAGKRSAPRRLEQSYWHGSLK